MNVKKVYMQDSQAVFFDIHKQNYMTRPATEAEQKLQNSHYDSEMKRWHWDKQVALYKNQHKIAESLADYDYSGLDDHTKVSYFHQAQQEKYGMNFDATVSHLDQ